MSYRNSHERRQKGYGMNLYRNQQEGKIAGVCAGLADHFDIAPWVARLIFIASVLFLGSFPLLLYIIAWILLSPRPSYAEEQVSYDEQKQRYRRNNMFNYRQNTSNRVKEAERRMASAMARVGNIERYVTSRRYRLDKEFGELS